MLSVHFVYTEKITCSQPGSKNRFYKKGSNNILILRVEENFQNYENYFGTDGKGSSILQELDYDWYEQDYQKYNVKAVLFINSAGSIPTTSGTAISSLIRNTSGSGTTILQSNDSVIVFVGSGYSSVNVSNGIYRPSFTGIGSVYFTPHEDFYYNSKFTLGTDQKSFFYR